VTSETCSTCDAFCVNPNNDNWGWCKLVPPMHVGTVWDENGKPHGVFNNPTTSPSSWCMDWEGE